MLNPGANIYRFVSWTVIAFFIGLLKKKTHSLSYATGYHTGLHLSSLWQPVIKHAGIRHNGSIGLNVTMAAIIVYLRQKNKKS
jgi:hypothetical protein